MRLAFSGRMGRALTAVTCGLAAAVIPQTVAHAQLAGASPSLTRAPYLTDLEASAVRVTWATTGQSRQSVRYGPPGDCLAQSVTSPTLGTPITVNGIRQYQNSVAISGLANDSTYCYRIFTGDTVPVDLLGTNPSPSFRTLVAAGSNTPFSFVVFGDWGDTTNNGVNTGALNVRQASIHSAIAASDARFALSTGDIAYPSGSQTNYGDLNQTGVNVSAVFGPSYWATPGQSVALHAVTGNHGHNATFLNTWPQDATVTASGGTYGMVSYPSILGTTPASYPTAYYAFSSGPVRFYVLEAAWSDSNVGDATGGACGSHCATYEVDRAAHWTATSAQYQWLAADLAAHPGGLKMAAFHFPLRSDDSGQPSDVYLQNTPGSTGTLEQLLHDNGVQLVFSGHSHTYQRHIAPPGGVISYVTGGGGGKVASIGTKGCSSTDAYGIGWSYTKAKGNACGAAPVPISDAAVYHYLHVSVDGSTVTVSPTDSAGNTFDVQTYDFGDDTVAPDAPGQLSVTQPSSTRATLTWTSAGDNVAVAGYDIYRNGDYRATLAPSVTRYADSGLIAGAGYSYQVRARDLAGNTAAAGISVNGGVSDLVAPSAPTTVSATATGATSASLSWSGATDDVGIASYTVLRDGAPIAQVPATLTSYDDLGLLPGSTYGYQIQVADLAGNLSAPSATAQVTTAADLQPPSDPGAATVTSVGADHVGLRWNEATDNVGVVRYDILRDGAVVASASAASVTDTTVAAATTYSYAVRAVDVAGNTTTGAPVTVTTAAPGSVFMDGFESGDLSGWDTVNGLGVRSDLAHAGTYAARQSSSGAATYAYRQLPAGYTELWTRAWVRVVSRTTSVNLFGFRTATGASIVNVYLDTNGRVSLRNNVGGVTTYGTSTVAAGSWHQVTLHAVINGTAGAVDVTLDGVAVPGLTLSGQNLGAAAIARLQLGETTTGRVYDVVLDDVTVASIPLGI